MLTRGYFNRDMHFIRTYCRLLGLIFLFLRTNRDYLRQAAHPVGVAIALLWRCLALGARLELESEPIAERYKKPPAAG